MGKTPIVIVASPMRPVTCREKKHEGVVGTAYFL